MKRADQARYPREVSFPITAFFRFEGGLAQLQQRRDGWLEFINPLSVQSAKVRGRHVPEAWTWRCIGGPAFGQHDDLA